LVTHAAPQVIFEDEDVLVVDKPGGMVCHSAQRAEYGSLAEWLREHGVETPRMINRLDRETSGLVVVAKNERAAKTLGKAVLRREIEKQYVAI
jgi:23S rRNA-/tRNA-specific pseudouridylate synthase